MTQTPGYEQCRIEDIQVPTRMLTIIPINVLRNWCSRFLTLCCKCKKSLCGYTYKIYDLCNYHQKPMHINWSKWCLGDLRIHDIDKRLINIYLFQGNFNDCWNKRLFRVNEIVLKYCWLFRIIELWQVDCQVLGVIGLIGGRNQSRKAHRIMIMSYFLIGIRRPLHSSV